MAIKLQQIIDAIVTRVAGISIANGHHTDIGADVNRGRAVLDTDSLPSCGVYLQPRTVEKQSSGGARQSLDASVVVEAHHKYSTDPEVTAIKMLADIQKAVEVDPENLDGLLHGNGISFAGDEISYPEEYSNVVSVSVVYSIPHVREYGNPDTQ